VRALVEAGLLFGLAENNLRVSLARLVACAAVERDERGRYRLGDASAAVGQRIGNWRRAEDRTTTWKGGWIALHVPVGARRLSRRHARAAHLHGFRELEAGLALRPANLRAGVAGVRSDLLALGLDPAAAVFAIDELDDARSERALALWDGPALAASYLRLRDELEESSARLPSLARERAMVESFLVGGRVLRSIVADPLLPAPIVAAGSLASLTAAMRRYDRLGRSTWAPFLAGHSVPHRRAPLDLRAHEGAPLVSEAT
jgi:phenylacetic acid degradation operon negative regulatory protein